MHIVLIHNPKSGDDDHEGEELVALIENAGHEVDYHHSNTGWQTALDRRPDLIAIAGGDGTVGEVVRATAGRSIPLTIFPTGTANNIAGWLGLSGVPVAELVAGWPRATLQPFDLGRAHGPWGTVRFLESVGAGLLAEMMSEIDEGAAGYVNDLSNRSTRISAALGVLERMIGRTQGVRCNIQLDDRMLSGEYLLVEVLNFGAAGPNLQLAPQAECADGKLDIVLVEAHERALLEAHLAAVRDDRADVPLPVHHARRVTITCEPGTLHLDDQLWSPAEGHSGDVRLDATVESKALTFLVPAAASARA